MVKKADEAYVSKEELLKKGFEKGSDGIWHKLNTLEMYAKQGWLDAGAKRYSAIDRLGAGNRLGNDYYYAKISTVSANDVSKPKVDGHGSIITPDKILAAQDRYNAAIRSVPYEFWGIVKHVCCDDEPLILIGDSERQKSHQKHVLSTLLCMGLDRLIDHYRNKTFPQHQKTLDSDAAVR